MKLIQILKEYIDDYEPLDGPEDNSDDYDYDYVSSDEFRDADDDSLPSDFDGFSPKLKQNQPKVSDLKYGSGYYSPKTKEDRMKQMRGEPLSRNDVQPSPYNPIRKDDMSLEKFLASRKAKEKIN